MRGSIHEKISHCFSTSFCSSSHRYSNAYQAEVGAAAAYIDPDNGSSGSAFGVDGTYYFNPFKLVMPLAEAAFPDRASNVNAHKHLLIGAM